MSSNMEFEKFAFDLPKNQSNVIKVIGVGGGGSNAINYMYLEGISGVDFYICNTDAQALQNSNVPNKIQLGVTLTEGLGAGANPEVGKNAAKESFEEISRMLDTNTKMVFITAGMGGGTGTGAAPIIAKMAKEAGILTVGIVTMPFQFEGRTRVEQAQKGIDAMRAVVDSLVVINNNKLREVYGNLGFKAGFSKADEVLSTAARGIAKVITQHYKQNIDLRDANTVLKDSGTAIMGSAKASGENRAIQAVRSALDSPLLNDNKITGAKRVLLLVVSGKSEITIDEIGEINEYIQYESGNVADIIMGVGEDETLEDAIAVTVIATNFNLEMQNEIVSTETKRVIHNLDTNESNHSNYPINTRPKNVVEQPVSTPTKVTSPMGNTLAPVLEKQAPKTDVKSEIKTENQATEVIKHTLDFDYNEPIFDRKQEVKTNFEDENVYLVPTSEFIKNIEVSYEEVLGAYDDDSDDFIIMPAIHADGNDLKDYTEGDSQFTLTFDFPNPNTPSTPKPELENHSTNDLINSIKVNEYTEFVPVNNSEIDAPIRYVLEDEDAVIADVKTKSKAETEEYVDTELIFEKKHLPQVNEKEVGIDVDPLNTPISEVLKERTEERRRKMKNFNHKFNNAKIDEFEKIPAYKRNGINIEDTNYSSESNLSRSSVGLDENSEIQIRNNNSFLHDNVD